MKEDKKVLLDMADAFIRNEAAMGIYYQVCSEQVPEFAEQWLELSKQEHGHADIFRKIKASILENAWAWSAGKYPVQALDFSSSDLIQKIAEMKSGQLTKEYIVNYVTDLENSGLETDLRAAFRTEMREFNELLARVVDESVVHRQTLLDINAQIRAQVAARTILSK